MNTAQASPPERRWSKRRQLLATFGLVLGGLLLATALIRFAWTARTVLHVADKAGELGNDVDAIAPDHASLTGTSVTPQPSRTSEAQVPPTPPAPAAAVTTAAPAPPPSSSTFTPNGASNDGGQPTVVDDTAVAGTGGSGGGSGGAAGSGGSSGPGGSGGSGGATPTFWESLVQSTLAWISQTTVSMCGPNTCNTGMVCCNASCGTCDAPGATCDQTQCAGAPRTPTNIRCGMGQCNDGQVCCNPSCGICTAPGETCSDAPCP